MHCLRGTLVLVINRHVCVCDWEPVFTISMRAVIGFVCRAYFLCLFCLLPELFYYQINLRKNLIKIICILICFIPDYLPCLWWFIAAASQSHHWKLWFPSPFCFDFASVQFTCVCIATIFFPLCLCYSV